MKRSKTKAREEHAKRLGPNGKPTKVFAEQHTPSINPEFLPEFLVEIPFPSSAKGKSRLHGECGAGGMRPKQGARTVSTRAPTTLADGDEGLSKDPIGTTDRIRVLGRVSSEGTWEDWQDRWIPSEDEEGGYPDEREENREEEWKCKPMSECGDDEEPKEESRPQVLTEHDPKDPLDDTKSLLDIQGILT